MNILVYLAVFMPIIASFLSFIIGKKTKKGRDTFVCAVVVLEFLLLISLSFMRNETTLVTVNGICGFGLNFSVDGFKAIYSIIAAFMWMMTGLFSPEYFAHYRNRNRYYFFWLLTLGATVAIFLSSDFYTTFIFFEIMSLASYVWVAQDEKAQSLKAAATYLAVAVIGGLVMLMGIFMLYHEAGTLMFTLLPEACKGKNLLIPSICLFVGFGAKAGAFPIHIWLPKAHPVAPAPASALLSGILTKTGIFGSIIITTKIMLHIETWGIIMLFIGVITMFLGALLALFSVNLKRTLACSSVSQIGFILVGISMISLLGEHNALAVRGTFLHMVNHSLFKLILFLVAAVVYMNTHKLDLNDIQGFGRKKPLLKVCYLLGALGIGGIPLFSGYVSKTLLHESIVEYAHALEHGELSSVLFSADIITIVEWIFLLSGGITVAYMTKLFFALFIEKNKNEKVQADFDNNKNYMKPISAFAVTGSAVIVVIFGSLPYFTMDKLADLASSFFGDIHLAHAVHYFTFVNLKGSIISILIGAVLYFLIVRTLMIKKEENGFTYLNRWPEFIDLEELVYRPLITKILPGLLGFVCFILDKFTDILAKVLLSIGTTVSGILDIIIDATVVFLRKTVYADSRKRAELEEGNEFTHVFGTLLNNIEYLLNKTIWKNHAQKKDLEHWVVLKYAAFKENSTVIERSLSYGLVVFCLGLCATLIYLLISAFL